MIPKFRAWMKSLKWMCDVTNISFDSKFLDICHQGDTERYTEMSVEFDEIEPSHYQGRYGMQSIDALRNFMTPEQLKGFYLGNALKYQLRFQKKNGLEDLKKARKNLEWLIEEFEVEK